MKSDAILHNLKSLPYFSKAELSCFPLSAKNIESFIYRAVKSGRILRLKRGIFTTKEFLASVRTHREELAYTEFMANILVTPSYISGEYVLAKHELLTETVTSITSITSERPTLLKNDLGNFRYRNTSNNLLSQFETLTKGRYQIKQASKVQALFDYLYLKKKELYEVSPRTVAALRLNLEMLTNQEMNELMQRAEGANSTKLIKLLKILKGIYVAQ